MKVIWKFFTETWIGSFGLVFSIYFFVVQHFIVPSSSMEKTMLIGDIFLIKKFSYGITIPKMPFIGFPLLPDLDNDGHIISGDGPKKGDIVVFRYPKDESIYFVKRTVATPGDEVIYYDNNLLIHSTEDFMKGKDTISFNDKLWAVNPYKDLGSNYMKNQKDDSFSKLITDKNDMTKMSNNKFGIYFYKKVKDNSYYMMGDNRDNSHDSRFFGSVDYKYIVGKAFFRIVSLRNYKGSMSFIE